jgi:hypothetical protein
MKLLENRLRKASAAASAGCLSVLEQVVAAKQYYILWTPQQLEVDARIDHVEGQHNTSAYRII